MRALIADDHPIYLGAVCEHLARLYSGSSIDSASSLSEVMAVLQQGTNFDLLLIDYSMPGMNGQSGVRAVISAAQGAPVVVMSGVATAPEVSLCIGTGAKAFLPKTLDSKIFASALNVVLSGGSYLPAEMFAVQSPCAPMPAEAPGEDPRFSERERSIMSMVVEGRSNKEIARQLNLREVTIKVQLTHIYKKLGAKNRAQAAMLMSQEHILDCNIPLP